MFFFSFRRFAKAHLNEGGVCLVVVSVPPVQDFSLSSLHPHMAGSVAAPEKGQRIYIIKHVHVFSIEFGNTCMYF